MISSLLHVTHPHSAWEDLVSLRLHISVQLFQVDTAPLVALNAPEEATLAKVQKNHRSMDVCAGKDTWRLPNTTSPS